MFAVNVKVVNGNIFLTIDLGGELIQRDYSTFIYWCLQALSQAESLSAHTGVIRNEKSLF